MTWVTSVRSRWARVRRYRWLQSLMAQQLIDNDFVAAQFGVAGLDVASAVARLAGAEERLGFAPHPLVEPAWMRLIGRPGGLAPYAPSVGIPLGRGLVDDTMLKPSAVWSAIASRPVTWSQVRDDAFARARLFARQNDVSLRRDVSEYTSPLRDYPRDDRLVSVIMPVLNRERSIGRAIDSVQAQTHTAWQLIVVDDGSTDGTMDVVRRRQQDDDRIVFIRHEGKGVSAARNAGIARATGSLLAFLDSDNTWTPRHLSACLQQLRDEHEVAVHSVVSVLHSDGRRTFAAHRVTSDTLADGRNPVDLNALVVAKRLVTAVGGFDETLRRWVDYDLVLRLAQRLRFELADEIGVEYDHRDSVMDRITTRESPLWRRVVLHRDIVRRAGGQLTGERRLGQNLVVIRNRNQWPEALRTAHHVLLADPTCLVAVVDAASTRDNAGILGAIALAVPRLDVVRTAGDLGWTVSAAFAAARHDVETVVAVRPGSSPTSHDLAEAIRERSGLGSRGVRASGVLFAVSASDLFHIAPSHLLDDPLTAIE